MAVSVTMPALGESVTEGTVTRWLKQPGDTVQADEPLLEVSTDKVDTEIPSPASGTLLEIKVGEDETVEVGTELATIGDAAEQGAGGGAPAAEPAAEQPAEQPAEEPAPEEPAAEQPSAQPAPSGEAPSGGAGSGATGTPVTMPALGESVTEGTVTRWLKQPGDTVEVDEPLLEVSTDKVDTELPSPASGTLLEIKVGEDETVDVGTELAIIGAAGQQAPSAGAGPATTPQQAAAAAPTPLAGEAAEQAAAQAQSVVKSEQQAEQQPAQQAAPAPAAPQPAAAPPSAPAAAGVESSPYVTPLVRKLAAEQGVDLASLRGTGVGGRIRKQDVIAAAEAARAAAAKPAAAPAAPSAPSAPAPAVSPQVAALRGRTEKMTRLRSVIAKRMVESLHVSAQLTTVIDVDVSAIARLRQRAKRDFEAREGVKLSFLPFFAKAALEALTQFPQVNATINSETNEVTYFDVEHLGVAVDTDKGLLVPVIKNAGDLNIAGIARRIADLAERTRSNKIGPDDLSGGTFTLTNTGSRGALFDTPIINQPQVAVLGTGAVVKRPVVVTDADGSDAIAIRQMAYLALTYDHRLVDGADAARFLATMKERLEAGAFEPDLGL